MLPGSSLHDARVFLSSFSGSTFLLLLYLGTRKQYRFWTHASAGFRNRRRRLLQLWHRQEVSVHCGTSLWEQANLSLVTPIWLHSSPESLGNRILQPRQVDRELSLSRHFGTSSLCPHVQPLLRPQSEPSRTGHNSSLCQFERWYSFSLTTPFWAICKP